MEMRGRNGKLWDLIFGNGVKILLIDRQGRERGVGGPLLIVGCFS